MTAPSLRVQIQGQSQVSADNLNTYEQTTNVATDLRAFIGAPGVQVYARGTAAVGDGGGGAFYWDENGTGPDNGLTIIVPPGAARGCWVRVSPVVTGTWDYALAFDESGNGSVVPTGVIDDFPNAPFDATIIGWTIQCDQPGDLGLDIWKAPFAVGSAPTIADSIVGSNPPTLVGAANGQSTDLTGWNVAVSAGDAFRLYVSAITTITRFTLILTMRRSVTLVVT